MYKILLIIFTVLLSGCVNVFYHIGNEIDSVYQSTCTVWSEGVCIWWNKDVQARDPIGSAWIELTYPFWLVDFPCEFVMDTVTLPYDTYLYYKAH